MDAAVSLGESVSIRCRAAAVGSLPTETMHLVPPVSIAANKGLPVIGAGLSRRGVIEWQGVKK